jgi:hypothetical protein
MLDGSLGWDHACFDLLALVGYGVERRRKAGFT